MSLDPIPVCPIVIQPIVVGLFMDPPSWIVCISLVIFVGVIFLCGWCVHICKKRSLEKEKEKDVIAAAAASSSSTATTAGGGAGAGSNNIPFVYGMGGPSLKDFQAQVSTAVRLHSLKRNGGGDVNADRIAGDGGRNDLAMAENGEAYESSSSKEARLRNGNVVNKGGGAFEENREMNDEPPPYSLVALKSSAPPEEEGSSHTADSGVSVDGGRIDDQPASSTRLERKVESVKPQVGVEEEEVWYDYILTISYSTTFVCP